MVLGFEIGPFYNKYHTKKSKQTLLANACLGIRVIKEFNIQYISTPSLPYQTL